MKRYVGVFTVVALVGWMLATPAVPAWAQQLVRIAGTDSNGAAAPIGVTSGALNVLGTIAAGTTSGADSVRRISAGSTEDEHAVKATAGTLYSITATNIITCRMADSDSRAGVRYTTPEILAFVERVHAPHDPGLAQAFRVPPGVPAIMVGPSEGKLIQLLCRLVDVRRAVEVGTLLGYSTIHIARALPPDGHLWTVEYER